MNDSSQVRGLLHLRMCICLQMSVTRRVFRRIPRVQAHRYRRGWANKVKERFWYSANSHSVMVACAYHLFFSPFAPSHTRHHCGSGTTSAQAFAETAAEAPDSARISSRLERRSSANDLAPKARMHINTSFQETTQEVHNRTKMQESALVEAFVEMRLQKVEKRKAWCQGKIGSDMSSASHRRS